MDLFKIVFLLFTGCFSRFPGVLVCQFHGLLTAFDQPSFKPFAIEQGQLACLDAGIDQEVEHHDESQRTHDQGEEGRRAEDGQIEGSIANKE